MKFIVFTVLLFLVSSTNYASEKAFDGYIVKFKKNARVALRVKSFDADSNIIHTSFGNFAKVDHLPSKLKNKSFAADSDIEYIEPNWIVKATEVVSKPSDSSFSKQWALYNSSHPGIDVNALSAWAITKGSRDVKIAVIDTGIDYDHPDLKYQMAVNTTELNGVEGVDDDGNGVIDDIYGYNAIDDSGDPMDDNFHGTHCAGIIGAAHDGQGIAGIMANVKLVAVKFMDEKGSGTIEAGIKGINYAISRKVNIMSNS